MWSHDFIPGWACSGLAPGNTWLRCQNVHHACGRDLSLHLSSVWYLPVKLRVPNTIQPLDFSSWIPAPYYFYIPTDNTHYSRQLWFRCFVHLFLLPLQYWKEYVRSWFVLWVRGGCNPLTCLEMSKGFLQLQIKEDVPQESVREAEFYTGVLESPSVPQDPSLCSYDCNYVHLCCMFYLVFRYEVGASG